MPRIVGAPLSVEPHGGLAGRVLRLVRAGDAARHPSPTPRRPSPRCQSPPLSSSCTSAGPGLGYAEQRKLMSRSGLSRRIVRSTYGAVLPESRVRFFCGRGTIGTRQRRVSSRRPPLTEADRGDRSVIGHRQPPCALASLRENSQADIGEQSMGGPSLGNHRNGASFWLPAMVGVGDLSAKSRPEIVTMQATELAGNPSRWMDCISHSGLG